jgi:putative inorganic carbon (hco3(-)) transporter
LIYSLWQRFTLADLSAIERWRSGSYIYRIIGSLQAWKQGSILMQWGDEIAAILTTLALSLAPFVSTEVTGLILVGIAAFWLLLSLGDRDRSGLTPIHITLFSFWLISAISTGLSSYRKEAIEGLIKLSLYLLFFVILARIFRSSRIRNWSISIYILVAGIISTYGAHQSIYGAKQLATWVDAESSLAKTTRVYSYLDNPNTLAGYLLPAIAFSGVAMILWPGKLPKVLAGVILTVDLWCLQATYCRSAWIGLGVMIIASVLLTYYWLRPHLSLFWQKWALPLGLGSLFLITGVTFLAVPLMRDRLLSVFAARGDSSNNFRINVWLAVKQMIQDRPILGIGPGDRVFKKVYPIYQINPKFSALGAYSVFMETIVEIGFLGFAFLLWLLITIFNVGWQQISYLRTYRDPQAYWLMAAIVSALGMMCQGMFDTVWYRPYVQMLWWFCVAIIAGFYTEQSQFNNAKISEHSDPSIPNE